MLHLCSLEIWIHGLTWTYGFRNFVWDQSASRTNKYIAVLCFVLVKKLHAEILSNSIDIL
ncbi:hypothetical protein CUMW_170810 [Citrus unshiu]|uniref:Uncharacterized protein n=1 Tax=Citrus unshiu TaxID=55188 RepID=A0A2H5PVA8_CITUN|nr:hypothetical protein CUMW_170810 [Citrus unshiu]